MNILILLLCSLPPLAVLVVAVIHGLRTGDAGTVSAVVVSALILTASTLFPLADEPEQSASFRFTPAEAGGVAARGATITYSVSPIAGAKTRHTGKPSTGAAIVRSAAVHTHPTGQSGTA